MKKSLLSVLTLAVFLAVPLHLAAITGDKPEFRKLADDVYVYVGKKNDANATDIEGIPDRSHLKVGMRFSALYEEQKERNETLEIQVEP